MSGDWNISSEEQPEFDDIFAVAITLGIRNKKKFIFLMRFTQLYESGTSQSTSKRTSYRG